jgi:mannose-binding lectin 2
MLLPRLSSLLCLAGLATLPVTSAYNGDENIKSIPLRTHSLAPPYLDSDFQSRWFDFGGDTIIRADKYATKPFLILDWRWEIFKLIGLGTFA